MPTFPTASPRFTDIGMAQEQLQMTVSSAAKLDVLTSKLCTAERFVERYCRRRFAPEPALADPTTGYQRRLLSLASVMQPLLATGSIKVSFGASQSPALVLPLTASAATTALQAMPSFGAGNVICTGGPLPTYPLSITFAGSLVGEQESVTVDSSGLGGAAWAIVTDCGFDSKPPVLKRFTTRGRSVVRVPDLRIVEAAPDPRIPTVQGVSWYGRQLLPTQYQLGYDAYATGGADEAIGSGITAEPSTEIILGYGAGSGWSVAAQFAFVLPIGYQNNDLSIVGRWGWMPPPPDIIDACYVVAARLYNERNAAYSDQMITQEGVVFSFFKQLPASTQAALDTYRVPNMALV